MSPSQKRTNGRSPLVKQQSQITCFFSRTNSPSPSPSPSLSKQPAPKSNVNPNPISQSPSPSPTTPSPVQSKPKKPLLIIGQNPSPSSYPSTPETAAKSYGKDVVDKRIRVYWPMDKAWYEGCVKSYAKDLGKHLIQYDDFEEELLDLGKEKIEWVEETVKKFKRLRKGSLVVKKAVNEEETENVGAVEMESSGGSGGVGGQENDSSDEDWGKNVEEEDSEVEDHMYPEDEDDEEDGKRGKRGWKSRSESKKRKGSDGGKVGSGKRSRNNGDVGKEGFKSSAVEPVKNKESK